MARSAFSETIHVALDKYGPAQAKEMHIRVAKSVLADFMGRQPVKPHVTIYTDGHLAANENEVKPFGVIRYNFLRMNEVVQYALDKARELSPVGTASDARPGHPGLYRESWFTLVERRRIDVSQIRPTDTVTLTNNQPYSRKINTGARGFERYAPPGVVEKVRQAVLKKYGAIVEAEIVFLNLEDAYVLKHSLRHIYKGRRYGGPRRDAKAGMDITYPSLLLTPKTFG